jgi:hypothetical protein
LPIWIAAIAGLPFLIVHSIYVRYFAKAEEFESVVPPALEVSLPKRIQRHSLAARLFHWILAASMFTLLLTAFLPKVGVRFNWVLYHWIAGSVLTVSVMFHFSVPPKSSVFRRQREGRVGARTTVAKP